MKKSNLEILACEDSELGVLCLRRRELLSRPGTVVTDVTLNHELLMSSYLTCSERALARLVLDLHPGRELRVLVGGLGLGYTAHEVLVAGGDRIAEVEVVEYLPQVIDWLERGLVPLADALRADPRLAIARNDVYTRLLRPPDPSEASGCAFDVILIDVDHSPEEPLDSPNARFYTEEGLRCARRHLAPGGVLGVWSSTEHAPFAAALRAVFANARVEPVTVDNDLIDDEQTDWLFFGWD